MEGEHPRLGPISILPTGPVANASVRFDSSSFSFSALQSADAMLDRLRTLARVGDIDSCAELVSLPMFYTPPIDVARWLLPAAGRAIEMSASEAAQEAVGGSDTIPEFLIKAYPVISFNQFGMEQRRVLAISNCAIYRLVVNTRTAEVEKCSRSTVHSLEGLLVGPLHKGGRNIADDVGACYGLRIYTVNPATDEATRPTFGSLFSKEYTPFRTFRPDLDPSQRAFEREIVREIGFLIEAALMNARPDLPGYRITEGDVIIEQRASLVTSIYNSLGLGK